MKQLLTSAQRDRVAPLFDGWEETLIYSCLEGAMGSVYTDSQERCAIAFIGDFAFYAGIPSAEAVQFNPDPVCQFRIMVPQSRDWYEIIQRSFGSRSKAVSRYAFRKDTIFDIPHLETLKASLPQGYALKMLDEEVYRFCQENDWCRDWVSLFSSYADYRRRGIGAIITKDGVPVAGASSYSVYSGGIEIEIQTAQAHRRKGLAAAAAAALILECLQRNLYPSWDAANLWSADLARKLGYTYDHEYISYYVNL